MKWVLIRHGKTQGNLEGRYIGCRTDEGLCPEGRRQLGPGKYPPVERIYVSPLRRCLETAEMLYPGVPVEIIPDFRECDFGEFENLNYSQLNGRADYQAWIDSGGEAPFPGGESREAFARRCVAAFEGLRPAGESCALIVHGGTIMAIMARYARTKGNYFDFQVQCGRGYLLEGNGEYRPL